MFLTQEMIKKKNFGICFGHLIIFWKFGQSKNFSTHKHTHIYNTLVYNSYYTPQKTGMFYSERNKYIMLSI